MAESLPKLRFKCPHCGCKLSVPPDRAGRRGKCPRCSETLTVPAAPLPSVAVKVAQPPSAGISPEGGGATSPEPTLVAPVLDAALLDLPPTRETDPDESQETYEQLHGMQGRYLLKGHEEPPERKLPWIIDIFLYPFNVPGLSILAITVGIPLILRVLLFVFMAGSGLFPPLIIFWVLFIVLHWSGLALLILYMNWYACECIRDSARGGIRAADTAAITPGLGDIFGQTFRVLLCVLACVAPAVIYRVQTHQVDAILWTLLGVGGFFLPMALLAVTMFESLGGLNPLLLAGSILGTPLPYCLLVPFCYTLIVLFPFAIYFVKVDWLPGYLLLLATYCVWLVLAHLLGRFYWKYEERLNWAA
ncbi:MAG: hypothetical protein JW993_09240 [Sedimentisphaerales bacterium]|nr:hypothetical protein [Sedimentisphaerales bacterium]